VSAGDWKLPWEGGCRCGALRFCITQPPLLSAACHCTGCQRMTGGAYSLTLTVPAGGFDVTKGEPAHGGLKGSPHRHCPECLSWVFTEAGPGIINVRSTMLDDASWVQPYVEFYRSEAFDWATTGAMRSYPKFPEMSDFGRLMQEFAAEGARPG
jgi:hypothetical protein